MRACSKLTASAAILVVALSCAFAQDPQYGYGIHTGFAYVGQRESTNLGTGNLTIQIPLLKLPGRNGYDYSLSLTYNSQIWSGGDAITPQGFQNFFWQSVGSSPLGQTSLSYGWSASDVPQIYSDNVQVGTVGGQPVLCNINYRIKWGDGRVVPYSALVTGCTGTWPQVYRSSVSSFQPQQICFTDRSVLDLTGSIPVLHLENGDTIYFGANGFGFATSREDSNGNQINFASSGSGITKDTLGRSVTSSTVGIPANSSFNYTYYDSNGNQQTIQMIYQSWTVNPSFTWNPCNGIQNCNLPPPGNTPCSPNGCSWSLLTAVILANGDRWDFAYNTFGELSQVTYPSGGYTTYQYQQIGTAPGCPVGPGSNGGCGGFTYPKRQIVSTQACRDTNTRANGGVCSPSMLDPATTITPSSSSSGSGTNLTSTVVDPLANTTAYTFGGPFGGQETSRQIYQGLSTLLRTITTTQTCDGPTDQKITLNDGSGLVSETTWTRGTPITVYVSTGTTTGQSSNLTQKVEYDWGSGAAGPKLRTTNYTWLQTNPVNSTSYTALPHYIINRKASEIVLNGAGTTVGQTTYEYDSYSGGIAASGAIQHDSNFSTTYAIRGNVDKISRWLNTTNTWLATINTYDDAGNVLTIKDPKNNVTSFSYADNFANGGPTGSTAAYVTQTTLPATGTVTHVSHKQYFFNTGLVAASCGENFTASCTNAATIPQPDYATFTYDAVGRPLVSTVGDGGQTTISYSDDQPSPPAQFGVTTSQKITSSANKTSIAYMDGIGEVIQTQLTSDPDGTDTMDTTYDSLGRKLTVSNPHRSSSLPTDGTSTYSYDALGRTTSVLEQDGSTVATSYTGNTVTVTDETGKKRKSVSDGLGRLTQVFEDPAGLNYETDYTYDALNNLLSVNQKGSAPTDSTKWRTRTFTYDSLSRLVCAGNPEIQSVTCPTSPAGPFPAGAAVYTYDSDSNVLSKQTPQPNQTGTATVTANYTYDALNRLLTKSYVGMSTAGASYGYDAVTPTGCTTTPPTLTDSYPKGQRTAMCDGSGATSWAHEVVGRVATEKRIIIGTSAWTKSAGYTYNLDGSIATISNPGVGRVMTYTTTTAGRAKSVVNTGGSINFITSATYTPGGALATYTSGGVVNTTDSYNSRLDPATLSAVNSSTGQTVMSLTYDFHSSTHADNGNVFQIVNGKDGNRTQNFLYDSFNRIQQAYTNGPNWGETISPTATSPGIPPTTPGIDAWGNLTNRSGVTGKNTYEALSAAPASNQNRLPGFGYDSAGNMTSNGSATYTYDADNRLVGTAGWTYVYDGDGLRVKKFSGSTGTLYWPDLGGNVLNESSLGATNLHEYVYFDSMRVARIDVPTPLTEKYYFADHLGSASVITDASGTIVEESDYYPYGGEITITNNDSNNYKFTGKERDAESGLDDFVARYYTSSLGRFMIPDWSAGEDPVPYASMGSPQTLNLYGYVMNNPVSKTDPTGHYNTCSIGNRCEGDGALIGGSCDNEAGTCSTSWSNDFIQTMAWVSASYTWSQSSESSSASAAAAAQNTTASNPSVQVNRPAQNACETQSCSVQVRSDTGPTGTPNPFGVGTGAVVRDVIYQAVDPSGKAVEGAEISLHETPLPGKEGGDAKNYSYASGKGTSNSGPGAEAAKQAGQFNDSLSTGGKGSAGFRQTYTVEGKPANIIWPTKNGPVVAPSQKVLIRRDTVIIRPEVNK